MRNAQKIGYRAGVLNSKLEGADIAIHYEIQRVQFLITDWHPATKALRESTYPNAIRFREENADLLSKMDEMVYDLIAEIKFPKK